MEQQRVWLDCDPGHDDFFAIVLASCNSKLQLIGVSTSAGNQTLEKTTENAVRALYACGKAGEIPVYRGLSKPLMRDVLVCPEIHGESGLDGPSGWPSDLTAKYVRPEPAVLAMYQAILSSESAVTLIVTGSFTNAAALLIAFGEDPQFRRKLEKIVCIGGCRGVGNIGPVMEFNFMVDPEAARIVFESGLPVVQIPLEVTHTALVTENVRRSLREALPPRFGSLMIDLLLFFGTTYEKVFQMPDPPLHDPLAVAYVLHPEIFKGSLLRVDVEVTSPLCAGQTIMDVWGMSSKPRNVWVAESVDIDRFWALLKDSLVQAGSTSPLIE